MIPPFIKMAPPQTTSSMTLVVNSKTPWMATLHPTVEGQRDRGCCVKQCSPMLLEIQWPRLNQQSRSWHGLHGGVADPHLDYHGCGVGRGAHLAGAAPRLGVSDPVL